MSGILLIDKPQGWTSHDVVAKLRGRLNTRRIGHAGTLDPIATGLLVLAVGPATRVLQYLDLEPKEYVFTVQFGQETDTYDADGEVVSTKDVPTDLGARIRASLIHFVGEIEQVPPMFSAVKKDGQPLYKYARKGQEIEREPRDITVYELTLTEPACEATATATLRCVCSGGTYVRSLAHDIGGMVGCGGHVTALRRTRVGRFSIEAATTIERAEVSDLIPLKDALEPMPLMRLKHGQAQVIQHGNFLRVDSAPNERFVALADEDGNVFSIGRVVENEIHPECVLPLEVFNGAL